MLEIEASFPYPFSYATLGEGDTFLENFFGLFLGVCLSPTPSRQPLFRVAQEPNRKPEPSEPFFPKPKAEPEPPEPFSRNRNRNRHFLLNCTEARKTFVAEKPPEPQTGTARTVPPPNRNRTEPNRGLPAFSKPLKNTTLARFSGMRLSLIFFSSPFWFSLPFSFSRNSLQF